jgi:hypothetical protein
MKTFVATLAALLLCATTATGATNTAYSFLRSDVSARPASLAGTFVSVTNDPVALFYNPASLATLDAPRGSAGFFKHLLDINAGYIAYGQSFQDLGTFAAGVLYTSYGSFAEMDDLGNALGSFTASDLALSVGYSNAFEENLTYGAAVKFIYSSIAGYSSTALACDVGILYSIPASRVTLGASIRNLGTQLSTYMGTREELPLDLTVGGAIIPRGLPLQLSLNFHKLNDDVAAFTDRFRAFTVGGEFTLSKVLQVRIGFDNEKRKDLKTATTSGLAGFSAGFGISVESYRVDYALSSLGKIGSLHRISVSAAL